MWNGRGGGKGGRGEGGRQGATEHETAQSLCVRMAPATGAAFSCAEVPGAKCAKTRATCTQIHTHAHTHINTHAHTFLNPPPPNNKKKSKQEKSSRICKVHWAVVERKHSRGKAKARAEGEAEVVLVVFDHAYPLHC
jgi:hypothetical protein